MIDNSQNLKKADYEIKTIPLKDAKAFVEAHHYSKGLGNTCVYRHGLFKRGSDVLLGVAVWLPPIVGAAKAVGGEDWRNVIALTRLAIHPSVPTGGASFLMGGSCKLIKREGRYTVLVTYADEFMKHEGTIYKATGWTDDGWSTPYLRWEDKDGRQVSKKATVNRTNDQMLALGYLRVGNFRKRRFVKDFR